MADVVSVQLCAAIDHWNAIRGSLFAPKWDVSILSGLHNALVPYCNVIDTAPAEPPFSYRFFGTGLARMHTFELTNKTTDSVEPEGFRNLCLDQYRMVIEHKAPLVFHNMIPARTAELFRPYTMVRLPLSDDGTRVSNILTVEEARDNPHETWERYRDADG